MHLNCIGQLVDIFMFILVHDLTHNLVGYNVHKKITKNGSMILCIKS